MRILSAAALAAAAAGAAAGGLAAWAGGLKPSRLNFSPEGAETGAANGAAG
jgi:hypothetical protein